MNEILAHTVILTTAMIVYCVVTISGHDGSAVLTGVLAYSGGVGVSKATEKNGNGK